MKSKLKEMRGITLIALVITIIVLLILAGVSIATLTGENGLLTQAQSSKTSNKKGEAEEVFKLISNEWQIEKRTNKNADLKDFLTTKKTEYGDKLTVSDEAPYTLEYNGEKIQIDNNGTLSEVVGNEKPNTLEPGLYDENYNLKMTWQQLLDNNYISVKDDSLAAVEGTNQETGDPIYYLDGILVVDDSVTSIANFGFDYYDFLTYVILPDSITSIGQSAFECADVSSINIPESVTSIGSAAFMSCKFTSITIPNSITTLTTSVFSGCKNLRTVNMSKSVKNIDAYAFESSVNLTINYEGSKEEWQSITLNSNWNESASEITVKCTDGDIEIPAYGQ